MASVWTWAIGLVVGAVGLYVAAVVVWVFVVQNVETPNYAVVQADDSIEVRDYPRLVVAEIETSGDRRSAVSKGFGPLAGYIFAKERSGPSIAMTAPVTQAPHPQTADRWIVRFVMPSQYDLATLPKPAGSSVRLTEIAPSRKVAIRFSGVATDDLIAANEAKVRAWCNARNLVCAAKPTYAYYNDPFTPGFLRRNEVLLDVIG